MSASIQKRTKKKITLQNNKKLTNIPHELNLQCVFPKLTSVWFWFNYKTQCPLNYLVLFLDLGGGKGDGKTCYPNTVTNLYFIQQLYSYLEQYICSTTLFILLDSRYNNNKYIPHGYFLESHDISMMP